MGQYGHASVVYQATWSHVACMLGLHVCMAYVASYLLPYGLHAWPVCFCMAHAYVACDTTSTVTSSALYSCVRVWHMHHAMQPWTAIPWLNAPNKRKWLVSMPQSCTYLHKHTSTWNSCT